MIASSTMEFEKCIRHTKLKGRYRPPTDMTSIQQLGRLANESKQNTNRPRSDTSARAPSSIIHRPSSIIHHPSSPKSPLHWAYTLSTVSKTNTGIFWTAVGPLIRPSRICTAYAKNKNTKRALKTSEQKGIIKNYKNTTPSKKLKSVDWNY